MLSLCRCPWSWPRSLRSSSGRRCWPTDRSDCSTLQHDLALEQSSHRQAELAVAELETPSRIVGAATSSLHMVHPQRDRAALRLVDDAAAHANVTPAPVTTPTTSPTASTAVDGFHRRPRRRRHRHPRPPHRRPRLSTTTRHRPHAAASIPARPGAQADALADHARPAPRPSVRPTRQPPSAALGATARHRQPTRTASPTRRGRPGCHVPAPGAHGPADAPPGDAVARGRLVDVQVLHSGTYQSAGPGRVGHHAVTLPAAPWRDLRPGRLTTRVVGADRRRGRRRLPDGAPGEDRRRAWRRC